MTVTHGRESALMRPIWKWLGVAGLAGVAATGVAVARAERRRAAYTPDQVRARLRERHARIERADRA
jgi:hypothetical protein